MRPFENRLALVSGASQGLGRAIAIEVARHGADVILVARDQDNLKVAAELVREYGTKAEIIVADITQLDNLRVIVDDVKKLHGPVDILINNAGSLGPINPFLATEPGQWQDVMQTNLMAPITLMRYILTDMMARDWGRVINVSSGAGRSAGMSNLSAYSVSKAALDMLSRTVASEITVPSIRINSVVPGVIDTAMTRSIHQAPVERSGEKTYARFQGLFDNEQLSTPEEAARLVIAVMLGNWHGEVIDVRDLRHTLNMLLQQADRDQ